MSHPVYLGGLYERANPGFDRKSKSNTNALKKDYCCTFFVVPSSEETSFLTTFYCLYFILL